MGCHPFWGSQGVSARRHPVKRMQRQEKISNRRIVYLRLAKGKYAAFVEAAWAPKVTPSAKTWVAPYLNPASHIASEIENWLGRLSWYVAKALARVIFPCNKRHISLSKHGMPTIFLRLVLFKLRVTLEKALEAFDDAGAFGAFEPGGFMRITDMPAGGTFEVFNHIPSGFDHFFVTGAQQQ